MDEVVVLRRGVRDDLRPEVEGVKEAVHPQHHQQEQHRLSSEPTIPMRQAVRMRERPRFM